MYVMGEVAKIMITIIVARNKIVDILYLHVSNSTQDHGEYFFPYRTTNEEIVEG